MPPDAPRVTERPSPLLRFAGAALAAGLRLLPRGWRWPTATRLARRLEPLIARTHAWRVRHQLRTDGLRETSLDLVLTAMTRHGTRFDPLLKIQGAAKLIPPGAGSMLVVGPHTMLSTLFLRYLEDHGHAPTVIAADPTLAPPGTRLPPRVLEPSPALLLQVRRLLKDGGTVAAMIDRADPERRNAAYATAAGEIRVSDALLQLACRMHVPIVFIATTVVGRDVACRLGAPSREPGTLESVVADFVAFVDRRSGDAVAPGPGASDRAPRAADA